MTLWPRRTKIFESTFLVITVAVFAPDSAKRTLQVALVNQVFDAVGISWSFTMAFALISSLPVIVMFVIVQKWFIAGLTAGAVKG